MSNRIAPVGCLFLLSPFIAEFLLGNLPARMLFVMLPLGLMYGTGAIFIRELVRHTNRSWLTLLLLAAAYGLIEEGLVTQSLFNPNYLHLRLLDYGFISEFGIGLPWLIYVITIHVAWSICVPIGLVECLFPQRQKTPWLTTRGVVIVGIAFVIGCALIANVSQKDNPYWASLPQLLSVAAAAAALVFIAFRLTKPVKPHGPVAPNSWLLFATPFLLGSLLMILQLLVEKTWHWPWQYAVLGALLIETAFILFIQHATYGKLWTSRNQWALMTGGIGVYMWFGFVLDFFTQGSAGLVGHTCIAAVTVALVVIALFKTKQTNPNQAPA